MARTHRSVSPSSRACFLPIQQSVPLSPEDVAKFEAKTGTNGEEAGDPVGAAPEK